MLPLYRYLYISTFSAYKRAPKPPIKTLVLALTLPVIVFWFDLDLLKSTYARINLIKTQSSKKRLHLLIKHVSILKNCAKVKKTRQQFEREILLKNKKPKNA